MSTQWIFVKILNSKYLRSRLWIFLLFSCYSHLFQIQQRQWCNIRHFAVIRVFIEAFAMTWHQSPLEYSKISCLLHTSASENHGDIITNCTSLVISHYTNLLTKANSKIALSTIHFQNACQLFKRLIKNCYI